MISWIRAIRTETITRNNKLSLELSEPNGGKPSVTATTSTAVPSIKITNAIISPERKSLEMVFMGSGSFLSHQPIIRSHKKTGITAMRNEVTNMFLFYTLFLAFVSFVVDAIILVE